MTTRQARGQCAEYDSDSGSLGLKSVEQLGVSSPPLYGTLQAQSHCDMCGMWVCYCLLPFFACFPENRKGKKAHDPSTNWRASLVAKKKLKVGIVLHWGPLLSHKGMAPFVVVAL